MQVFATILVLLCREESMMKPVLSVKRKLPFVMTLVPALLAVLPSLAMPRGAYLVPVQAPLSLPGDSAKVSPPSPFLSTPSPLSSPPSPAPSPLISSPKIGTPAVVIGCNGGGCLDSSGNWYSGAGGVYLNKEGTACARTGVWLQCN
jgi:hypothetical protein